MTSPYRYDVHGWQSSVSWPELVQGVLRHTGSADYATTYTAGETAAAAAFGGGPQRPPLPEAAAQRARDELLKVRRACRRRA